MQATQPKRLNLSKSSVTIQPRPKNLANIQAFNFFQPPPVETGESLTLLKREMVDQKKALPIEFPFKSNEVIVLDDSDDDDVVEVVVRVPKRKRTTTTTTPQNSNKKTPHLSHQDRDLGVDSSLSEESTMHSDDSLADFVVSDDAPVEPVQKKRRIWKTPQQSQTELLEEGLAEVQDETPAERLERTLFG